MILSNLEINNLKSVLDKERFIINNYENILLIDDNYNDFEILINLMIDIMSHRNNKCINDNLEWHNIIFRICLLNNGYKLLNKINYFIDKINKKEFLLYSSLNSNLLVFLFWYRQKDIIKSDDFMLDLIKNAIKNDDERILNLILKDINNYNKFDTYDIENIITKLFISNIPKKFVLRKMKIINNYINLSNYFKNILDILINFNIEIIPYLFKYYNNNVDFEILIMLYYLINNKKYKLEINEEYNVIININNYNYKKYDYFKLERLSNNFFYKSSFDNIVNNNFSNYFLFFVKDLFNKNITYNKTNLLKIFCNNNFNNYIIDYFYSSNNLFRYDLKKHNTEHRLLLLTKYYVNNKINDNIKYNKLLFLLRIYIRKYKKNKIIYHKSIMYNVLNEIKNKNMNMLSNNKNLIKNINNNNIVVNKILLKKYSVTAEYDETNNIYYILDIDIPNFTNIDKYSFLLSLHPVTKDIINNIYNYKTQEEIENIYSLNNLNWIPKIGLFIDK